MADGVRSVRNLVGRETRRRAKEFSGDNRVTEQIAPPELQAKNEVEQLPPAVQNGRMAVRFVKFHPDVDAEDNRIVGLEISLFISTELLSLIPRKVVEAYEFLTRTGDKRHECQGIGPHFVEVSLAPEGQDGYLELKSAGIERVQLAAIEETGTGNATDVIRLSFRIMADFELMEVQRFACKNYGKQIWLKMEALQGLLL